MTKCSPQNAPKIYPNIHYLESRLLSNDVTSPVTFPDVDINNGTNLKLMTYPETFREICEERLEAGSVDYVVTWFFIDTAHNVIEYVDLIENILKPNGIWINMGGLQYMYEPYEGESSIELAFKDLKGAIIDAGLIISQAKLIDNYEYFLEDSDVQRTYKCPYFTCTKNGKLLS